MEGLECLDSDRTVVSFREYADRARNRRSLNRACRRATAGDGFVLRHRRIDRAARRTRRGGIRQDRHRPSQEGVADLPREWRAPLSGAGRRRLRLLRLSAAVRAFSRAIRSRGAGADREVRPVARRAARRAQAAGGGRHRDDGDLGQWPGGPRDRFGPGRPGAGGGRAQLHRGRGPDLSADPRQLRLPRARDGEPQGLQRAGAALASAASAHGGGPVRGGPGRERALAGTRAPSSPCCSAPGRRPAPARVSRCASSARPGSASPASSRSFAARSAATAAARSG